ncbi:putative Glucoside xylosyltransferase 1 [Daphnia magna]|uniref:UDP-D-xylose:beta-D-glucoside alpha-1,3-D-xylosyltransferase n=1 Tax=Daphnia magna TaxID=35525 RepID=A0A164VUC7_9CRUS|nr:putative Glucoside xylosyltransferase 1 [Daphnia magna]
MARKTRFVIRAAALASFLCVLSHIFAVFRPQQRQQVSFEAFSSSSSSLVLQNTKRFSNAEWHSRTDQTQEIRIVTTVCGGRTAESLAMMKSALIMSRPSTFIRFIVLADNKSIVFLTEAIRLWPDNILNRMSLDLRPISFPGDGHDDWKALFKLCSAERLFLPSLLKEVDSVLYMDVDTVFLSSPLHVWQHLGKMSETQMVALAPDEQDYADGWYPASANHPYHGKFGVNAGVMLMNLTKMRHFGWEKYVVRLFEQYKHRIMWGDQDLINIFFHFHPEKLYVYPCNYNYLAHHWYID